MFFKSLQIIRTMSLSAKIPVVDIDPAGVFKYILIKLTITPKDGASTSNEVVRGYAECGYHADIDDKFTEQLQKLKEGGEIKNWTTKVLGGGRIDHNPDQKTINVYGYSQGFGKADHQVTVRLLKTVYKDYEITWSDEGY